MRYFVDTEFVFDADKRLVVPLSVGVVAEDGREYYAVYANWWEECWGDPPAFVAEHAAPALEVKDVALYVHGELGTIKRDLMSFVGPDSPEFWGDYAAFDYVVLSLIMGGFDNWPPGWPMIVRDLQETPAGREASGSVQSVTPHNALSDARAVRDAYELAFADNRSCAPETEARR